MTTVADLFGNMYGPQTSGEFRSNPTQFLTGIEYEIESITNHGNAGKFLKNVTEDGSLRNNGYEYITNIHEYDKQLKVFKQLHETLKYGEDAFTHRTSIHVHVNMLGLEVKQLKQFILLYVLTEPLFFKFVGKERENSVFCVPLYQTYLSQQYHKSSQWLAQHWHKYTAFNLLPLEIQGSIEFRHMFGTNDFNKFETWLSSIKSLYDFVVENPQYNLMREIQNKDKINSLCEKILPKLYTKYDFKLLENTMLDVKLSNGGL